MMIEADADGESHTVSLGLAERDAPLVTELSTNCPQLR